MFQQSILDYTQAIQLDNRFAIAHANRANSYANLGQYPQAFTDYEQALHLKPDDAITYMDRGVNLVCTR